MRKLSFQKIFCLISFIFLLTCCIYYGYRFISLYIENNKEVKITSNSLSTKVKENNFGQDYFKAISGEYYFYGDEINNNYVMYSNMLWRIIKINYNGSLKLVLDDSITSLAYGENITNYESTMINYWLNNIEDENNTGILENLLNKVDTYLDKVNICIDQIDEISSTPCKKSNSDYYLGLLSTLDYINTGNTDSFLINEDNYYLSNTNTDNDFWYITNDGKFALDDGTTILGVRPVINIKSTIDYISGDGSSDNPYYFETETSYFGGYVKLDNDLWRIYDITENDYRLVLTESLDTDYKYSSYSSYFNDTTSGNASYYINNTFLNSLSYNNIVKYTIWSNGYYGESNNYDYRETLNKTIETKVAFISVGNVIFNNQENAWTTTGLSSSSGTIYTTKDNNKLYSKMVTSKGVLIPTIAIDKDILTKGKGLINEPFEME